MTDNSPEKDLPKQEVSRSLVPLAGRTTPAHQRRQAISIAEPEAGLSPRRVLDAIRFWWKWALPTGIVLGTAASLTVYLRFVPQFEAAAWIRIEEHVPFLAFESKNQVEYSKGFVPTQIELLRSPMVVRPVIVEPEIAALPEFAKQDDPVDWLRKQIVVKRIGESELYTISFTCSQPKAAARVVNMVVKSYFELRESELQKRTVDVVKILRNETEWRLKEVESLRNSVREMAKQVTGIDPFKGVAEPNPTGTTPLAGLVSQLISNEVDETVLSARLRVLEAAEPEHVATVPASLIEAAVADHPKALQLADALAEQRLQLDAILARETQGKDSSVYKRAVGQYGRNQQAFEALKKEFRSQEKARLEAQRTSDHQQAIASLKSELSNRTVTKEILEERYATELKNVQTYNGDSVTLRFEQDKLARAEKVLDLISERMVVLSTEQGAPQRVWEMRPAAVPVAPIQTLPYLNALVAMLAGLAAPFGLAVVKEQLTGRISNAEHFERNAYLAVLGEIIELPTRKSKTDRLANRDHRAIQMFQECIESLRSSLLLGEHSESLRILAVTSAVNKEGKTSVAVQLAASIARATQKRVLVIDGDLRAPGVHSVFEVPRMPGLTHVLSGDCSLEHAIIATRTELVDVLPAGFLDGNPHRLLEERGWSKLIENIPPEYRYVIVDSPPVLSASEALVLARSADAVLLCAMQDVTRLSQFNKATERVLAVGAKVAGVVLSGVPASDHAGRYGNYFQETER